MAMFAEKSDYPQKKTVTFFQDLDPMKY